MIQTMRIAPAPRTATIDATPLTQPTASARRAVEEAEVSPVRPTETTPTQEVTRTYSLNAMTRKAAGPKNWTR